VYHQTTRRVADYAAQKLKSGKEMYRLIMDGIETSYKDLNDPGKEATSAQVEVFKMLYQEARCWRMLSWGLVCY
jgi:hypothetical protein